MQSFITRKIKKLKREELQREKLAKAYYQLNAQRNMYLKSDIDFSLQQPINSQLIDQLYQLGRQYSFNQIIALVNLLINKLQNQNGQLFKNIGSDALKTLKRLIKFKIPKKFIFCYLQTMDFIFDKIKSFLNHQKLQQYTNNIPYDYLAKFVKFFRLKMTDKQCFSYAQELLAQNLIDDAMMMIDMSNNKKQTLDNIINKCLRQNASNQTYKALGKMIRKSGFGANHYPQLLQKLEISAILYFVKLGWEHLQQICLYKPNLLAFGVNMLINKSNKLNEAVSIVMRNKHLLDFLSNHDKKTVQKRIQNPQTIQIANPLQKNHFGPSQNHFLHLKDLGIERQNVIYVNQKTSQKQVNLVVQEILHAKIIAIDTESTVLRTALDNQLDVLALIQIAVKGKVFLLDARGINKIIPFKNCFTTFLSQPDNIIVGHALQNDLTVFKDALNIECQDKCRVLQIKTRYPKITEMHKGNPSLAKLCVTQFKKELCKKYTLTNWQRRPLLQNQIHYAALDSYAVLQLYYRALE